MNALTPSRREILSVLFKERKGLLILFFSILVIVTLASYLMTSVYEADAKLLVRSGREFQAAAEAGQGQIVPPYVTKQEIINSELEILNSNDLWVSVIDKMTLAVIYPNIADSPPSNMRPIDAALLEFKKDFKAEAPAQSEVIALTYFNRDRDVAIKTLSTFITLYEQKHAAVFGENKSGFFDEQVKAYEDQLNDLTHKITDLRQQDSLFDVTAQRSQLLQDRSSIEESLRSVESRSVDAHGRIDYFRKRLKSLSPLTIEGDVPSDSVETAKAKLLDLLTQLDTLKARYAEDVKPIKDLEEQIQSVRDFIGGASVSNHKVWMQRDPAYDDANLKLQSAEADAVSVDAQVTLQRQNLEKIDVKLKSLEDGARTLEKMERDHSMLDDRVRGATTRYEDARSNEGMDKQEVVSISILEQPDASTKPAKPKHVVFALVGFALGIAAVGVSLFYILVFRGSLITAESVERLLNIPVCVVPEGRVGFL